MHTYICTYPCILSMSEHEPTELVHDKKERKRVYACWCAHVRARMSVSVHAVYGKTGHSTIYVCGIRGDQRKNRDVSIYICVYVGLHVLRDNIYMNICNQCRIFTRFAVMTECGRKKRDTFSSVHLYNAIRLIHICMKESAPGLVHPYMCSSEYDT